MRTDAAMFRVVAREIRYIRQETRDPLTGKRLLDLEDELEHHIKERKDVKESNTADSAGK